ncbi:hypothetical protein FRB90_009621 [Tulasnella sp. 427]|nr:hypothetical protein FRB90_009621 [Tulasnella sp. 427]
MQIALTVLSSKASGTVARTVGSRTGQTKAWKHHHRRICKDLPQFLNTIDDPQQRLDSILVAQLVAEHLCSNEGRGAIIRYFQGSGSQVAEDDLDNPLRALFTLQPTEQIPAPPLPLQTNLVNSIPRMALDHLFSTIHNNHFSVSALDLHPIAHAVFPIASRAFNHSCLPNATACYRYDNGFIWQDTRALTDIEVGEEITISYIDPASSLQSRRAALRHNYGFECKCTRCQMQESTPPDLSNLVHLETALRDWIFSDESPTLSPAAASVLPVTSTTFKSVPSALRGFLFNDEYLPELSGRFTYIAHSSDPTFESAAHTGLTLLALYYLIYPRFHPLVGLHCLELCKVVWNVGIINPKEETRCRRLSGALLGTARSILEKSLPQNGIGSADTPSPWGDLKAMEQLIREGITV